MPLSKTRIIELLKGVIEVTADVYDRCAIEDYIYFNEKKLSEEDVNYLRNFEKEFSNHKGA